MKILTSYILILVTIYDNIITEGKVIDINMVSDIIYKLGNKFESYLVHELTVQNEKSQICSHGVICEDVTIQVCYARLMHFYNNHLMYKIVDVFNTLILRLLNEYNVLVMALLSKYTQMDSNVSDAIANVIHLDNSKAYCVIGFLSIINVELDDKLQDFVFFANLMHIYEKKRAYFNIKTIVETHFGSRADGLRNLIPVIYSDTDQILSEVISSKFPTLRDTINDFSLPFCETNLQWIQPDSWLWTNLESFPRAVKSFDENYNLLNWQDLKMEFKAVTITGGVKHNYSYDLLTSVNLLKEDLHERCKDLFLYILDHGQQITDENIPEDIQNIMRRLQYNFSTMEYKVDSPIDSIQIFEMNEMDTSLQNLELRDSLSTLFQKEYHTATFSKIEDFYLTVSKSMDAYVINVLFYRVLEILVYVLEVYNSELNNLRTMLRTFETEELLVENIINQFLYLGDQFTLFQATWELYTSGNPLTLDKYTIPDVDRMFNFARFVYLRSVIQYTVSPFNIERINTFLKDVRFRRVSGLHEPNTSSQWSNPSKELAEINIYLLKLVELKIPNVIQF
ncbi:Hypothetical protein CINCED_3A011424 [Cinara cedri]|uniref:Uncharacterized protein n=1 Tax=Cinara cedri TaxID=506608 RepID=A0A5E4NG69_9HEMI|nr:Hypothetical protein CINCED_3A011424 [Cinara cedri]